MKHKLSHYDNNTPIEKIHLVYLKLKKRQDERRKVFSDFINYIPTVINPTNKKYNIFFKYNDDDIGKISIDYNNYWGGWAYSKDRLNLENFNKRSTFENRDEKLDYLEDTELKFELGKKFKDLEKLSRNHFCAYFKDVLVTKIKNSYFNNRLYEESIKEIIIINNISYFFLKEGYKVELINLDEKKPIII